MRRIAPRLLLVSLFSLVALEVAARGWLRVSLGSSFTRPRRVLDSFYPELAKVRGREIVAGDGVLDVLVLGGSVPNPRWSSVEPALAEVLTRLSRQRVWIHNLATEGHTSRDSLTKYEELGATPFDLVLLYHGINESRTNNVPPDMFDAGYRHYRWYRDIERVRESASLDWVALPYAVSRLVDRVRGGSVLPPFEPPEEWLDHGATIASAAPFRANYEAILALARERGQPVVTATFATWFAPGYTREAFSARELAYSRHRTPLHRWGRPENVRSAVEAHNAELRGSSRSPGRKTACTSSTSRAPCPGASGTSTTCATSRWRARASGSDCSSPRSGRRSGWSEAYSARSSFNRSKDAWNTSFPMPFTSSSRSASAQSKLAVHST